MSISHGKLIELKGIKKTSKKTFLDINLLFEKDIDMFLEIDEFTGENIKIIFDNDTKYKYRLSFYSYFDSIKGENVSSLTKTYLDESIKIYFPCSEDYISNLNSIRQAKSISDLDSLNFLSIDMKSKDSILEDPKIRGTPKNTVNKSLRLSFISFGIIFIMFFTFLLAAFLNQNVINEKVIAESIHLDNDIHNGKDQSLTLFDKEPAILQNERLGIEDTLLLSNSLSNQTSLPFVELDEEISYSVPKGKVALTFDDGPSKYSREIVDILEKYDAGGTFFFIGRNIKEHTDDVEYVHSKGYSIGAHSLTHPDMRKLSYDNQKLQVVSSVELIEEITNEKVTLFRPPYGAYGKNLKDILFKNNYKMTLWNNDPEDWRSQNSDKIFNHIKNTNVSGSIILLHETRAVTDALPRIIEYLQEMELEIVNLK